MLSSRREQARDKHTLSLLPLPLSLLTHFIKDVLFVSFCNNFLLCNRYLSLSVSVVETIEQTTKNVERMFLSLSRHFSFLASTHTFRPLFPSLSMKCRFTMPIDAYVLGHHFYKITHFVGLPISYSVLKKTNFFKITLLYIIYVL